jgi:uncharacterized membrane protein YfcA
VVAYSKKARVWLVAIAGLFALALLLRPSMASERWIVLLGVCFACELIDSGLGMGYGTILTPTLLLLGYAPSDIVPTILFSELLSGAAATFFHGELGNIDFGPGGADRRRASILAAGSVVGVSAGVILAARVPDDALRVLIGCVILLSGMFVILLARRVVVYRVWKMVTLAGVASFNKAISGGGYGPLVTSGQILSGVQGKAAVGITSFAEAATCLVAVVLFLTQGGYLRFDLLVPMVAGALASVPFSAFAIHRTHEAHLKLVIGILTAGMGVLLLYKAVV